MSDNHYCVIGKLKLVPIEGSKTLQLGYFDGLPYAVDKNITEDDLVAIFLPDGQLSEEFAAQNDLIQRVDESGKRAGGFFGKNRKVRSIKLMGGKVASVGFVAPLSYFVYTGWPLERFQEGDSFNSLGDHPICGKFVTEASRKAAINARDRRRERRKSVGKLIGFPQHQAHTHQFMRSAKQHLDNGDLIYLTWKRDGTSVRIGNAYEEIRLPWWKEKLDKWLKFARLQYVHLTGTRRVNIRSEKTDSSYYGTNELYTIFGESLRGMLYPGECLFGEIVGWRDAERPLFNRGGMFMTYGCPPGVRKLLIYNIKWTLPNGQSIDLPWPKVKQRCFELGLETVPEVSGYIMVGNQFWSSGDPWDNKFMENLESFLIEESRGPDPVDPSHIKEGICIRVEKPTGTVFLKYKSEDFYALESKSKDEGMEDIEEIQSELLEEDTL